MMKQSTLSESSGLQIFTGCHSWHVRNSSHTLDTVLTTDCGAHAQKFQLALGIDLPHAINLGFSWAATGLLESAPMPLEIPSNVRVISVATLTSAEEGVRLSFARVIWAGEHDETHFYSSDFSGALEWRSA